MTFYSLSFLVFFLVFSLIINKINNIKIQHAVFFIANTIFYAYWDYRFLLIIWFVILLCYGSALLYSRTKKALYIHISAILCLLILGVFKYFNFFSQSFADVFGIRDHLTLNLVLPMGISFYLFQAMSYLFDVLYKKIKVETDFLKLAVYISFFPQITSGPIVKSKDFLPQLDRIHKITKQNVYEGIQIFLIGLTKKIVIADNIGVAVDAVYNAPSAYNGISVICAIIGYSFQIYCDFSGYSNMAIGIAKIWGFDLGENFNAPYIAKNPSDFWRRWHISLSTWFRDYVYIPLGGNRKGKIRTYFNLFITMVLSGIWHGANFTFILWGIFHGLGSALHKASKDLSCSTKKNMNVFSDFIKIILTFTYVSLAWVIFRAKDLKHALSIYSSIFNFSGVMYISVYFIVFVLFISIINIYSYFKNNGNVIQINMNLDSFKNRIIISLWVWAIILFMYCGDSAFIYAQF